MPPEEGIETVITHGNYCREDTDEEERYTLAKLNQEYPMELLEKHGLL